MTKQKKLACLLSIVAVFFLGCVAEAKTTISYPESGDIGQAFVVTLSSKTSFEAPSVTWMGRTTLLDVEQRDGEWISYALLGSHVRDVKPDIYTLKWSFKQSGKNRSVARKIRLRKRNYPEERLNVPTKMVVPVKVDSERIKKEARLTRAARNVLSVPRRWTTPPLRPVPGIVTSSYGFRRIYNGIPKGYHAGTDYRAAVGTSVRAPFAGTVVLTGEHYYAGRSVFVDSGNGVISMFFHLDSIGVKKGDVIIKGQVIGKSGATGRITGPHLHYGLSLAGQYVDPHPLFSTSITAMLKKQKREILH